MENTRRASWCMVMLVVLGCWVPTSCHSGLGGGGRDAEFEPSSEAVELERALARSFTLEPRPWPQRAEDVEALGRADVVVLVATGVDGTLLRPDVERAFTARYGAPGAPGLLLLGAAGRIARSVGVAEFSPAAHYLRHGDDELSTTGAFRYGMAFRDHVRTEALRQRLSAEADAAGRPVVWLGSARGDVACSRCIWPRLGPRAVPLADERMQRDGRDEPGTTAAVYWPPLAADGGSAGGVMALSGWIDVFGPGDRESSTEHTALIVGAVEMLAGPRGSEPAAGVSKRLRVAYCVHPAPGTGKPSGASALAPQGMVHWGFVEPNGGDPQILRASLEAARQSGADLCVVQPHGSGLGPPWADDDPIRRPEGYWPPAAPALFDSDVGVALDAAAARVLLAVELEPTAAVPSVPLAGLAATKWWARQLADRRRLGAAAVPGFAVRSWFPDAERPAIPAAAPAVWRGLGPSAFALHTDRLAPPRAGWSRLVAAERGGLDRLPLAGLSAHWRSSQLARGAVIGAAPTVRGLGHGATGDWIMVQSQDAVRALRGGDSGAVLLWRGIDDPMFGRDGWRYVRGLSADPLRAAVAGRLWAIGRGGLREIALEQMPYVVPPGAGAETTLPASTPFLQSNHVRFYGSGGPIAIDRESTARFCGRGGHVIAKSLFTTRVRDARGVLDTLSPAELRLAPVVTGSASAVTVDWLDRGGALVEAPERPRLGTGVGAAQRLRFRAVAPPVGAYRSTLRLKATAPTLLAVRRNDEIERWVTVDDVTERLEHTRAFGFDFARNPITDGADTIELELWRGGPVELLEWKFERSLGIGQVVATREAAGPLAELVEWSGAEHYEDRVSLRTAADLPGISVDIRYRKVGSGAHVLRAFGFEGWERVVSAPEQELDELRRPFGLVPRKGSGLPGLWIVPVRMTRTHRFVFDDGKLTLHGFPRSGERVRFGVFLASTATADPTFAAAWSELVDALQQPPVVDLVPGRPVTFGAAAPTRWLRPVLTRRARADEESVSALGVGSCLVRDGLGFWRLRSTVPPSAATRAKLSAHDRIGGDDGGAPEHGALGWLSVPQQSTGRPVAVAVDSGPVRGVLPAPGSSRLVALRTGATVGTPSPRADAHAPFEVRIDAHSPLLAAPGIVAPERFGAVRIAGRDWRYYDDRTVWLPGRRLGVFEVELLPPDPDAKRTVPHLAATRAVVTACSYDPRAETLVIACQARPEDGEKPTYTAWIRGPKPVRMVGASWVDPQEQALTTAQQKAVRGRGWLIRMVPGTVQLVYR